MRTIATALLAALVLYSSSGARYELARYKMFENCLKSSSMWQAQAEGNVRFECELK